MLVPTPRTAVAASASSQPVQGLGPVRPPGDHLGQHRVVVGADHGALGDRPESTRTRGCRGSRRASTRPPVGQEARAPGPRRRPAPRSRARSARRRPGRSGSGSPGGDPQLQLDQVEPGDHLGDRVLDLQPGVHLQEEELLRPVAGDDELDGARAGVAAGPRDGARPRRPSPPAWRGRRAAATAPPRRSSGAGAAAEHSRSPRWMTAPWVSARTWISMCRGALDEALDQQGVVAERAARLAPGRGELRGQRRGSRTTRMPLPPPPAEGLTSTGKPTLGRGRGQLGVVQPRLVPSRDDGDARPPATRLLGADLVAHRPRSRATGGPTKTTPASAQARANAGVLGEEAVAGVDRLGAGAARGVDDPALDRQVAAAAAAPGRSGPPRRPRATCGASGVGVGVDRDRADAQARAACG